MIYELAISIYKKLRSKVSVKKTKTKIRKTTVAIKKSRFVKQVRVFIKDTHDTFTAPLYSKYQQALRKFLSSPVFNRFKPAATAIKVAWRFTLKKLSNLPQLALVAAILTPLFSTIILEVNNNRLYGVSQEEKTILTKTSVKKDLIKDTADAFLYNRGDDLTIPGSDDPKLKQLLFAASKENSSGKEPYQAKLPKNPREGIVFGDAEGIRQFTITPNHGLSAGRLDEDSRIVYPKSTTERHIYTLKTNGIKNDITLLEAPQADSGTNDSIKTYTYSLDLGDSLEARQLPSGDIGIYSADPALFGNVQVGDEKSQELVDKARSSNEKNTLVFEIPKPFIIDSSRKINYDDVSFKLVPNQQNQSNPTLELEVRNLSNLPYPVSIDPTIVVTTTSDFQQNIGNNDNIDTSIDGQITRGSIGSGAVTLLGSSPVATATGGTVTFYVADGSNGTAGVTYQVHTFSTTGSSTFSTTGPMNVEYLIVGGGGGGGGSTDNSNAPGGGGGAGGLLTNVGSTLRTVNGNVAVTVGNGGGGGDESNGGTGGSSSFDGLTANGGGGGGYNGNGLTGGSGGGASGYPNTTGTRTGGAGTASQGFKGGDSTSSSTAGSAAGGGGGAAGAGGNGSTTVAGNGGGSVNNNITGTSTAYAGGGGGGRRLTSNTGGSGGGGGASAGASDGDASNASTANRGSGGGGGAGDKGRGGSGSTGVVIIRYASTGPTIITPRDGHASVAYNGYLYTIGGNTGSRQNDIQYCPINSNGAISICSDAGATFDTAGRDNHSSVVHNGYLYVIGGFDGTNRLNTIRYCQINPDGTITSGSCGSAGTFNTARDGHTSVVYNGYLYIIGGWNGTTRYNDIQRCVINSNGTVTCDSSPFPTFNTARDGHTSVVYNGYLYIIGGNTGSRQNDIQYCPINSNGSVGTCVQQTNAFNTARDGHTSVVYNGYLYTIGGWNGTTRYNDIQNMQIISAGRAGPSTNNLSGGIAGTGRSDYASAIYNGVMYITGGWNGTTYYDDIQRCTINTNGTIGSCTTQSNMFAARRGHSAVAYNGFLYIIGGLDGVDKRELVWLPINADGSIGTSSFASGGQLTSYIANGTNGTNGSTYYVHTFSAGTSTFNTNGVNRSSEYMVLGGGGGGGGASLDDYAGGGGAGGLVHNVGGTLTTLTGSYTITVGSGGAGGSGAAVGSNGGNSSLGAVASVTGGGASSSVGGSGGGGSRGLGSTGGGAGTSGQGSAGGASINLAAGGGGGKNGVGAPGSSSSCGDYCTSYQGGNGGSGISLNITGSGVSYAGGGGGGGASSGGLGGSGIGGAGSSGEGNGGNAVAGTGSGGGGAVQGGTTVTRTGGSGSDGRVIIRYVAPTTNLALFNTARREHTSFVYNNYLYIVGGYDGATQLRSVERCVVNTNGSIGTCTDQSTALITGRHAHSSVNVGNKFYVIGGEQSGGSKLNTIEVCDIDGTTGAVTCNSQPTTFSTGRRNHGSVYYNGYIYIIGGSDTWRGGTVFNDLQYCPVSSAGIIGTCISQSNVFGTPRSQFQPVVYNGILYAVAGWNGSSDQTSIEYTRIGPPEGRGGSSTTAGTGFTTARKSHASVAYNGYLYVIGGGRDTSNTDCKNSGTSTFCNDIQYCPINSDGTVGTCLTAGYFTTARSSHASVAYNGYLYVIGGWNGSIQNDIQYCPINSNGTVGTCLTAGTFANGRDRLASVAYNGYLYVIGGWNGLTAVVYDDIQYCPINSNGTVGTCLTAGAFTNSRLDHTSVAYNGYLYIIGGLSLGSHQNDIQYCPINSNGSVGTCVRQTNAFNTGRGNHTSVVYNEYIYIIGGWNGTTRYNDIQYCPINVNGSVGICTQQASAFTTARYSHASTIFNGYLYINGGNASTGDLADIQYLPLLSTIEAALYERTINIGTINANMQSYVIEGSTNCTYTVKYRMAGSDSVYGTEVVSRNVRAGVSETITGGSSKRYVFFAISMDDSTCGGASSITSINLVFSTISPFDPTLLSPANGATGVSVTPEFRLGSADAENDYLRYKIEVCSTSNCSSIARTIDQTLSQTGWVSQSQQSGTAFSSGATAITQYAIHNYQTPALNANTQYWWRGYAIDPGGSNTWSGASAISTFTTGSATLENTNILGGTTIRGGTNVR